MITSGWKANAAYTKAGYTRNKEPALAAYRLKQKPRLKAAMAEREALWQDHLEVTRAEVARELTRVAMFDPRKLFDEEGNLRPLHGLDDDTAGAIAGLEHDVRYAGKGEEQRACGRTSKVKIADKVSALRELASILRMKPADQTLGGLGAIGPGLTVVIQQHISNTVQVPPRPEGVTLEDHSALGLPGPEK